jgi:hypothetical protein
MTAVVHIIAIEIETIRRDYCVVRVVLQNIGDRIVGPGTLIARQISDGGSGRPIEFFNSVALAPNDTTKVSQLLSGVVKSMEFRTYRETDGDIVGISGLIKRTTLSFSEAAETFVTDFLVPVYKTVTTRIQEIRVKEQMTAVSRQFRRHP